MEQFYLAAQVIFKKKQILRAFREFLKCSRVLVGKNTEGFVVYLLSIKTFFFLNLFCIAVTKNLNVFGI